ncbi:TetR/AcrR family transcriptional regulator [Modicisalibacter radicis]|uniref:TetR/AcrR family transcriptional regulator n=1 Tax=Halomonas sp. EAR18 TaxID=2518972 RepID=UPI001B345F1B|nr:TetR/AcrR family transcriptional regulator [Halomonas sp. EAR18]
MIVTYNLTMNTPIINAKKSPRGRPREFDIDQALDAALIVFRERGYNATSISDLRAAMGLTAGSLYKAFKDKRAIFIAALDRYIQSREVELARHLESAQTGREKVLATLRCYGDVSHDVEGRRGCLVLGGLTDIDTFDAKLAHRFRQALSRIEHLFAGFIELGVQDESLPNHLDVEMSARYLLCMVEGMRVLGKRGANAAEIEGIVLQAMRSLD